MITVIFNTTDYIYQYRLHREAFADCIMCERMDEIMPKCFFFRPLAFHFEIKIILKRNRE